MKIQDIAFIIILLILIFRKNPRELVFAGLVSLALSIPLFSFWIFFTAQRLVFYAVILIASSLIVYHFKKR